MDVSKLKELKDGSGNFGKCYIVDEDTLYKRFFLGSDKKFLFKEDHFKYTSNIDNDSFIFPQEIDADNGIVFGYTMKYIHAKRLDKIGFNFSVKDLIFALQKLKEDIRALNERKIIANDLNARNMLYDGNLYIIDTDFFIKDNSDSFDFYSNEQGICIAIHNFLIRTNIQNEMDKLMIDNVNLEEINHYLEENFTLSYLIELLYEIKEIVYKLTHKDIDNFKQISKILKRRI